MVIELPDVITKINQEEFEPNKIYESLLKETDISENNAKIITNKICRFLIGHGLKIITSPMIREIACVQMLDMNLEKERLQYTRIGLPYYDYEQLLDKKITVLHIHEEYLGVRKLIEELKNG